MRCKAFKAWVPLQERCPDLGKAGLEGFPDLELSSGQLQPRPISSYILRMLIILLGLSLRTVQ